MGRPRYNILYDNCFAHLTFRCHNQAFYFKSNSVKNYILKLWKKYKDIYNIKIIDFVIMDNHSHLFVFVENPKSISRFMQATNSRLACFINKRERKKNQVIADRFKSPTIEDPSYFEQVIHYIWNNPVKAGKIKPQSITQYPYCSLYYRYRGVNCDDLLSSYEEVAELTQVAPIISGGQLQYTKKLLKKLVSLYQNIKGSIRDLIIHNESIFEHLHTIGTHAQIQLRKPNPKLASP